MGVERHGAAEYVENFGGEASVLQEGCAQSTSQSNDTLHKKYITKLQLSLIQAEGH